MMPYPISRQTHLFVEKKMRKINSFEWKFSVIKELQEYRCCKKSGIPPRSVFLMLKSGLNQHVCRFPFLWAINPCWLAKSPFFAGTVPLISRVTANFSRSTHQFLLLKSPICRYSDSNFLWVKTYQNLSKNTMFLWFLVVSTGVSAHSFPEKPSLGASHGSLMLLQPFSWRFRQPRLPKLRWGASRWLDFGGFFGGVWKWKGLMFGWCLFHWIGFFGKILTGNHGFYHQI
jgi:hypothetical protein